MGLSTKLLDSRDLPEIFKEIYLQGLTGVLFAERLKYKRSVYFQKGAPIFATSNLSEDKIGKILFTQNKISMDQLMQALDRAKQERKRLGSVLVELGHISAKELFEAVVFQVEQVIHSLFDSDWREARYSFDPGAAFGDEVIKLSVQPTDLLMEGIQRSYNADLIALNVGDLKSVYARAGKRELDVDRLKLSAAEKVAYELIDGNRTIAALIAESGASKPRTLLLLYVLKSLGYVETAAGPKTVAAPTIDIDMDALDPGDGIEDLDLGDIDLPDEILETAKLVPPTAKPAAAPAPKVKVSQTQTPGPVATAKGTSAEDIKQQTAKLRQMNFYQRLGISHDAPAAAIVGAYSSLRRKFESDLPATLRPAGKAALQHIIDAYKGLALEGNRRVYDGLLAAGGTAQEIETKFRVRMAASRYEEGKRAWGSKDVAEAEKAFREAIELDPAKPEFYFGLGLVLAEREADAPGYDEIESVFTKAVALQSDHPRGYYYLGTVFRHKGQIDKAVQAYRRALSLDTRYEPAREGLAACGQSA